MSVKKLSFSLITALALVLSLGFSSVAAAEQGDVEYITVDQELVDKATEVEQDIDQYVDVTEEGYLQLDTEVESKYGEELYKFFLYGVYMINDRIAAGDISATQSGITPNQGSQGGITTMASGGCSWSNFGKSLVTGALGGATTGAIGGAVAGGLGAAPGAGVGAIGGVAAGGVQHFSTCWW